MADERKPVTCPQGHEMKLAVEHRQYAWTRPSLPPHWFAHYYCDCGWIAPDDGGGDTKQEAINAAYAAATRRPPNKPLTREQIYKMHDLDAIWIVYPDEKDREPCVMPVIFLTSGGMRDEQLKHCIIFASNPTPADIEEARKARKI